jgi:hypothetical protein
MRFATFALAVLMFAVCASAVSTVNELPPKYDIEAPEGQFGRVGGETIATAVYIPGLPYYDTGNTTGYINDYDQVCDYTGSTSPDVVYFYEPPYDQCVSISLCNSFYDTKVYVYEDMQTPLYYCCNDDNYDCVAPPVSYTSWIPECLFLAGHTYYIVVDGYGYSYGDYVLEIEEVECTPECVVECPPDAFDEGEGPCYDGYVDGFNGGCNSDPYAYVEVAPSSSTITYCGLSGNYDANTLRDTDWYLLDLTCETTTLTVCLEAEFGALFGLIDMSPGCPNITSLTYYLIGEPCDILCLTETLPAGLWTVFVAPSGWANWPCDSDYVLTIDGYETCVPVEDASWSTIKAMYK